MEKEFADLSLKELSKFLRKKFHKGLYPFAMVLAYVLRVGDLTSGGAIPAKETMGSLKKRVINLKKKTIDVFIEIEKSLGNPDPDIVKINKKTLVRPAK